MISNEDKKQIIQYSKDGKLKEIQEWFRKLSKDEIKELLEVTTDDKDKNTPLHIVCGADEGKYINWELAKFYLECGADINAGDAYKQACTLFFCIYADFKMIREFFKLYKPNFIIQEEDGKTIKEMIPPRLRKNEIYKYLEELELKFSIKKSQFDDELKDSDLEKIISASINELELETLKKEKKENEENNIAYDMESWLNSLNVEKEIKENNPIWIETEEEQIKKAIEESKKTYEEEKKRKRTDDNKKDEDIDDTIDDVNDIKVKKLFNEQIEYKKFKDNKIFEGNNNSKKDEEKKPNNSNNNSNSGNNFLKKTN